MVDIETGGTEEDAAIFTIGACSFNRYKPDVIHDRFEVRISMEDNTKEGRKLDGGTIAWWFQQSEQARADLFGENRTLKSALVEFRMWIQGCKPAMQTCWANDPDFDVVILRHAYKKIGDTWPFFFALNRSCRTIFELAFPDKEELDNLKAFVRGDSTHHNAVDDAVNQARMVQHCYKQLGLS